jgi:hypothetical protein
MNEIGLTNFASRYWNPDSAGTTLVGITPDELCELASKHEPIIGTSRFVRTLRIPNESQTRAGIAEVTNGNRHLLVTGYKARTPNELPVLGRWFEGLEAPVAKYLNIIMYSREQLALEAEKTGSGDTIEEPWGIVAINAEVSSDGAPIPPTTMLRNALGMEYGGNGQSLDSDEYLRSVAFWSQHATVRPTLRAERTYTCAVCDPDVADPDVDWCNECQ